MDRAIDLNKEVAANSKQALRLEGSYLSLINDDEKRGNDLAK